MRDRESIENDIQNIDLSPYFEFEHYREMLKFQKLQTEILLDIRDLSAKENV